MIINCLGEKNVQDTNPFFTSYKTPFEVPDFRAIKVDHFLPAIEKGIEKHKKEIAKIINNKEKPTFKNVIIPMERSGKLLNKVVNFLFNQNASCSSTKMRAVARKVTPLISRHYDEIILNNRLFSKIKAVYDKKDQLAIDPEGKKVLEEYYNDFIRSGANLTGKEKD